MPRQKFITPNCCDKGKTAKAVFLLFHSVDDEDGEDGTYKNPPIWMIRSINEEYGSINFHPAEYCPFCGTLLPEIERVKNPPEKVCKVTDGGYYCDTCGDRLMSCDCASQLELFQPKI